MPKWRRARGEKGPGKCYREGLSLAKLFKKFPDDEAAEKWFVEQRWPNGVACPQCGSLNVKTGAAHSSQPFRCREKACKGKRFSVKTGSVMQNSNLGYQVWAIACYLFATNLKSISSMKLHRELEITQKTAWHLAHRLRQSFDVGSAPPFKGPVETDETHIGGKRKNMSNARRKTLKGRGAIGKAIVVGTKDRRTNKVVARVIDRADGRTLKGFIRERTVQGTTVYTDEASAYKNLSGFVHESVTHSVSEYVRGMAHTNGIESFWAIFKRGYHGTFHQISKKHLNRYIGEFAGRHNIRPLDTIDMMGHIAKKMLGKRLRYSDLTAG